jgi:hypothetical protein
MQHIHTAEMRVELWEADAKEKKINGLESR